MDRKTDPKFFRNKTPLKNILYFHASNDPEIFAELLQKFSKSHHWDKNIPHVIRQYNRTGNSHSKNIKRTANIAIRRKQSLVIFDELMFLLTGKASSTAFLNDLALKRCYHKGMNIIFVCQDLTYASEKLRMLFSNSNYIILFPNNSDKRNTKHVLKNRGLTRKKAENLLKEAFESKNYPYLILGNSRNCPENIQIRQGVFPDENMYAYE